MNTNQPEIINNVYSQNMSPNIYSNAIIEENKIESITITPNELIINNETFTNNIENDVSNALIEIIFIEPTNDISINNILTIRDKNLKTIPSTDISLSDFTTSDDGKTWRGLMSVLKYQLYYFNASILIEYNSSFRKQKFNVDSVNNFTYSNKLIGPTNEVLLTYYKSGYEIRRYKGIIYYVYENGMTSNSSSIFGINEKNYQNTSIDKKIPIGYNSNFELYNEALTTIASDGEIISGIGNITNDSYNFKLTIGFITYTLTNVDYADALIEIIEDVLSTWLQMIKKPNESKFENETEYNEYTHSISFIISEFNPSIEDKMISEILTSYGSEFGSTFPKTSTINISKTYIESKKNPDNTFTNSIYIDSIKNSLKRSIGNVLGIGHYWYLPSSPIKYDTLNRKYYAGVNGLNKYIELFSSLLNFNNRLFGLPIEDYESNSIFMEEGTEGSKSTTITLNGLTHPGLDKEIMTKWIDYGTDSLPISIVSLGLLEDIGYDVCYNNVDTYNPGSIFSYDYEIYIDVDLSLNKFENLTDIYIQNQNKYFIKMPSNSVQQDLDKVFSDYISTIINNSNSLAINELIIIHNSNIDANWTSFKNTNDISIPIMNNIHNETYNSTNETYVYSFKTIKHSNGSITALLDKKNNN